MYDCPCVFVRQTGECMEMQRTGSRLTQDTWDSHQLQQPSASAAAAVDPRTLGLVCCWRPELLLSPLGLGELLLIVRLYMYYIPLCGSYRR